MCAICDSLEAETGTVAKPLRDLVAEHIARFIVANLGVDARPPERARNWDMCVALLHALAEPDTNPQVLVRVQAPTDTY